VGNFPTGWAEWNDKYRDTMRAYWKGDGGLIGEFSSRLTGSSDLYGRSGRRPHASVNFVAAHDGFTVRDVVSYNEKHNEANGEDNRDGANDNRSWNCGVEGPTDDPDVVALRDRQRRNFLTGLLLSQGVPMLLGGDETGRTQGGNNNAYCQDGETSWLDWASADEDMLVFTRRLLEIRRSHPVLRRRRWFQGRPIRGIDDIAWFRPDGKEMSDEDWDSGEAASLAVFLNGDGLHSPDEHGHRIVDDSFLLFFNGHHEAVAWTLPGPRWGEEWSVLLDTTRWEPEDEHVGAGSTRGVEGRSALVLVRVVP